MIQSDCPKIRHSLKPFLCGLKGQIALDEAEIIAEMFTAAIPID